MKYNLDMDNVSFFLVMHLGRWDEIITAIMMKKYATFRDLVEEVVKIISVDLTYNCMKLKYKIEVSNAPLKIHNEVSVRVYVC